MEAIILVNAKEMPADVLDYCVDHEISTHYRNDVAMIEDDGNPFAEWLKSKGIHVPKSTESPDYILIGIWAT